MKLRLKRLDPVAGNIRGQGLTEYITLLVLIALVAVGATKGMGKVIREKIKTARNHIKKDINFDLVRGGDSE